MVKRVDKKLLEEQKKELEKRGLSGNKSKSQKLPVKKGKPKIKITKVPKSKYMK
jgi:hypothetical protein